MYSLYIVYFILTLGCIFSAMRIRQGFNEGSNTPFATIIFCFCLVLICSIGG